jgi:glycosyltransferase involved in cell wall biosynthesis
MSRAPAIAVEATHSGPDTGKFHRENFKPVKDDRPPCVSIAMPVLNSASTLSTAIQSILNQTFSDWELLILDDGSTDETVHIVREYSDPRIRVFTDGTHRGIVARLNQAIALSRGKYFARMDGDDVSYPERLALQVDHLEHHPEIDLLGGAVLVFGRDGRVIGKPASRVTHEQICRRPWSGFYLAHPTWMGKMEWFTSHPYRSNTVRCEDQDLLLRTHENSCFAALPEIVLGYRGETLSLRGILDGRRSFVQCVAREYLPRRKYLVAAAALIEQTLKGLADTFAIGTGLNYRILRHRALPVVDTLTVRRWKKVWDETRRIQPAVPCA